MAGEFSLLAAEVRALVRREGLAGFLRWWRDGLVDAAPHWVRRLLLVPDAVPLMASGEGWSVLPLGPASGTQGERWAETTLSGAAARSAFSQFLSKSRPGSRNVWLILGPDEVLVRSVSLPLAAEEDLRAAVGFDLDRLSPFASDRAAFDVRVAHRDVSAGLLRAELTIAPRSALEPRIQRLQDLGARVLGAGPAEGFGRVARPPNLLQRGERDRPALSASSALSRLLALLAAALALVSLLLPAWHQREQALALIPVLEAAKAEAVASESLARDVERLSANHNFMVARKHARVPMVRLLDELSTELPDNTWVQQLEVEVKSGGKLQEVRIAGETGASTALIAALERPGTLTNATFKSPLTKGATPNSERFLVSAELKQRALPEPIPEPALMKPRGEAGADPAPASRDVSVKPEGPT